MKRKRDERLLDAIRDGDAQTVRLLLRDPTVDPTHDNHTCVVHAAKRGSAKILWLLLNDSRIDPRVCGNTLGEWVLRKGSVKILRAFLEDGRVDFSRNDECCNIVTAVVIGRTQIVQLLLSDHRVDPSVDDNMAICCAARQGHLEIIKMLLADPRVDPSADENDPIRFASYHGHEEIVRVLLKDPRVDPSDSDNRAVQWAADGGHTKTLRLLLDDPRVNGFSAIPRATRSCLGVLAADSRYHIVQHRDLYLCHYPLFVLAYDAMVTRCMAMAWVALQHPTWRDMIQPLTERWRAGFFD